MLNPGTEISYHGIAVCRAHYPCVHVAAVFTAAEHTLHTVGGQDLLVKTYPMASVELIIFF